MTSPPKLDTNRAWQEAHATIKGNREAFLAIAGVFFLLPGLAFTLLYPQPPMAQGAMTPDQAMVFFEKFYRDSFPFLLAMVVAQIVGSMAILRLYARRDRPTVGDALSKGLADALFFFAATILVSFVTSLGAAALIALAAVTGQQAVAGLVTAAAFVGMLYVGLRVILLMPIFAVEGSRQPIAAIRRAWSLTRGNTARILLFLIVLMLAYAVISGVVSAVLGTALAIALGAEGAKIAVAVVASAFGAVFTLYLIVSLGAIHRQLAGPSAGELQSTFE